MNKIENDKERWVSHYFCGFCKNEFDAESRKIIIRTETGKNYTASNHIRCSRCGNFLKHIRKKN